AVKDKRARSLETEGEHIPRTLMSQDVPALPRKVVTGADGKFRLGGFGSDRLVLARISAPSIATEDLHVLTRPGRPIKVTQLTSERHGTSIATYYGASFRHAAAPTRAIV